MKPVLAFVSLAVAILVPMVNSLGFVAAAEGGKIRPSALAGSWYPANPGELRTMLTKYLEKAILPKDLGRVSLLISPHAGYAFSGQAAAYGFKAIRGADYNRVVIIAPSHYGGFRGICVSSYDEYETPLGQVSVDRTMVNDLSRRVLFVLNSEIESREHAVEMQLPYLQMVLKHFSIVPLIIGELDKNDFPAISQALRSYINEKTLVVVSSDFTHYGPRFGFVPFRDNIKDNLKKLDMGAVNLILEKDTDGYLKYIHETGTTICGYLPIGLGLELLSARAKGTLLVYYTSGDLLNDYSSTVSYVSLAFDQASKIDAKDGQP